MCLIQAAGHLAEPHALTLTRAHQRGGLSLSSSELRPFNADPPTAHCTGDVPLNQVIALMQVEEARGRVRMSVRERQRKA